MLWRPEKIDYFEKSQSQSQTEIIQSGTTSLSAEIIPYYLYYSGPI